MDTGLSINNNQILIVRIEEPLIEKKFWLKAQARVVWQIGMDEGLKTDNNIIVYFSKSNPLPSLTYGSKILCLRSIQPMPPAANPGGFDYQDYASVRHISGQVFLKQKDFLLLSETNENVLQKILIGCRRNIIRLLRDFLQGRKTTGLAEAILIGYKEDLDPDIVRAYSQTGVMHIIAISGLHLALIYGIIRFFLKPLRKKKSISWLSTLIALAVLWFFSLLTGASASVLRAALMFSCLICGEQFSKNISSLNSLCCSAFLLLCYDPFLLWDIGFQLSYAAVLSMIVFQKKIYLLLRIQNKLLDMLWQSVSVCLAAQMLTSPLSIYYFHQFPVWFILSNILAVPLSSLILVAILLLLPLSLFPAVARPAGAVISRLIDYMNSYIGYIDHLPFSNWKPLMIDLPQTGILYFFIFFIFRWLSGCRPAQCMLAGFSLVCFSGLRCWQIMRAVSQQRLIVYNVPDCAATDFISGTSSVFFCTDSLPENRNLFERYILPSRNKFRISHSWQLPESQSGLAVFRFAQKRLVLISRPLPEQFNPSRKIDCDLIIVTGNPEIKIEKLNAFFNCRQWVFDSSNKKYRQKEWQEACEKRGLRAYSVSEKGAFVMNFN